MWTGWPLLKTNGGSDNPLRVLHRGVEKTASQDIKIKCPEKAEYIVAVLVTESEFIVFLDGQEMTRYGKPAAAQVTSLELWGNGRVKIDQIRLRRAE